MYVKSHLSKIRRFLWWMILCSCFFALTPSRRPKVRLFFWRIRQRHVRQSLWRMAERFTFSDTRLPKAVGRRSANLCGGLPPFFFNSLTNQIHYDYLNPHFISLIKISMRFFDALYKKLFR